MNETLTPFFWVAVTLPLLLLLQRWIHRHLRGLTYLLTGNMNWAVVAYAIILFPGVLLHELSHWVAALLLRVRTGSISLLPKMQKDGSIQLGYVEYYKGRTLDPVRESLVGGAPLLTGTIVLLLIGYHVFDVTALTAAVQSGQVRSLTEALGALFETPDFLVWLYLIFAVSTAMMPSPSDRRAWPAFLVLLVLIAAVVYLLDLESILFTELAQPVLTTFANLGLAFSLAVGVDIVFIMIIYLLEQLVSNLKGVELRYERVDG